MNTNAYIEFFLVAGDVVRPAIVAGVLAICWLGLRQAGFDGRVRRLAWLSVAVPFIAWFALATQLGEAGVFEPNRNSPIPKTPFAIVIPLAVGLFVLMRSRTVATVIDATSPGWMISIQVYRVFGAVFIAHWGAGNLPGVFALPAGFGDTLVGTLAIPVALYVNSGARGGRQAAVAWNLLGIADLVNAVTLGFLSTPGRYQMLAFDNPNQLVGTYPLVMIPAFAVPLSLILHGLSLWQLRRAGRRDSAMRRQPAVL